MSFRRKPIKLRSKGALAAVEALKPEAKRYEVRTELPGLLVVVHPSGIKTYVGLLGRGKRQNISENAHHPVLTPEAAYTQGLDFLRDPEARRAAKTAKRTSTTFKAFVDEHYAPWVEVERKAGRATVANIRAQFSEFDKKPLTDITAWAIEKFKAKRIKAGTSPVTVNRDLDRIRAALNKAVEWKLIAANPISGIKRAKVDDEPRVRYLEPAEEMRLRTALAKRETERRRRRISGNTHALARGRETLPVWAADEYTDHVMPLVLLAMNTGLRRGELLGLTWEAIDRKAKRIKVAARTAKSARVRYLPINAEAMSVIERLHKHAIDNKAGLVFAGAKGSAMTHIKRSWASLTAAADLSDFHFHDCRHHFASRLVMAGVDLYAVKELLGHSDFAMTQRYAHLSDEHKAEAVEKLVRR